MAGVGGLELNHILTKFASVGSRWRLLVTRWRLGVACVVLVLVAMAQ